MGKITWLWKMLRHVVLIAMLQVGQALRLPLQPEVGSSTLKIAAPSLRTPLLRRDLLSIAFATAGSSAALPAFAAPKKIARTPLKPELVLILRVKEACEQETRLIKTGKFKELQRLNVKRAIGMMIENYDLRDRFVRASAYAPADRISDATIYGNTATEALIQILEYFPSKLVATELTREQQSFVLSALSQCSKSIDSFLALMPSDEVRAAVAQVEEENYLNKKEFPDGEYLNAPEVGAQTNL